MVKALQTMGEQVLLDRLGLQVAAAAVVIQILLWQPQRAEQVELDKLAAAAAVLR